QQSPGYGYGAGPQQGGGQQQQQGHGSWQHPAFGGFLNDSTAQMGFQVGRSAVAAGQDYVEQNVCRMCFSTSCACFIISTFCAVSRVLFRLVSLAALYAYPQIYLY
ncbi:MAG: hypothetical protein INR71_12775, partial [Terriglobus roseus]|nr:hypothetical protein [Terriglobus roseus]